MATELATGYVSLVASARGIAASIATELGRPLERAAKIAGQRMADILGDELGDRSRAAGAEAGDQIIGGVRSAMAGLQLPEIELDDIAPPLIGQPEIPEPAPLDLDAVQAPLIGQPEVPEPDQLRVRDIPAPKIGQPEIPEADSGKLISGAKKAGVAAGAAATAGLGVGFVSSLGAELSNDRLAAQLGIDDPTYARELGKTAGRLYAGAWGESLGEVNVALRGVLQNDLLDQDAANADIERVTAKVLDLASAFEQDLGGASKAAGQLIKTGMAKDADEALDIIVKGFQSGLDRSEDFLDTITEYGTQFRKLGIDGPEALGLLRQGLQGGARDADVVADAIKEFSIRAVDGSELTAQGFRTIGVDARAMAAEIGAGGSRAAAGLDVVLDRVRAIPDPVERSAAAVALFGTQAEDLGDALFSLDPSSAVAALGEVEGAAERMGDTLNDNATTAFESFKRNVETRLAGVVGSLAPVIGGVLDLAPALGGLALVAPGVGKAATAIGGVVTSTLGLGPAIPSVGRFAGALGRLGAVAGGIGLLATGMKLLNDELVDIQHGRAPDLSLLGRDLVVYGQSGRAAGEVTRQFGGDLGGLADKIRDVTSRTGSGGILGNLSGFFQTSGRVKDAKRDIEALDQSLAELVATGNQPLAVDIIGRLAKDAGVPVGKLTDLLDGYRAALADVDTQQRLTSGSSEGLNVSLADQAGEVDGVEGSAADLIGTLGKEGDAFADLTGDVESYEDAMNRLIGVHVSAERAAIDYVDSHQRLAEAVLENGRTLDLNTEAGRANRSAILDIIDATADHIGAMREEGATADELRATFATHRGELERVLGQLGLNKAEADRYLGLLDQVPESVLTTIGVDKAKAEADLASFIASLRTDLGNALVDIPLTISTDTRVKPRAHGGPVQAGQPYVVGEHRPELFIPDTAGIILPEVPTTATRSRINHFEFTGPIQGLTLEQVLEEADRRSRLASLAGEG